MIAALALLAQADQGDGEAASRLLALFVIGGLVLGVLLVVAVALAIAGYVRDREERSRDGS